MRPIPRKLQISEMNTWRYKKPENPVTSKKKLNPLFHLTFLQRNLQTLIASLVNSIHVP